MASSSGHEPKRKGLKQLSIIQQTEGRRIYLFGNTFSIKDILRDAGAKWDSDRKAWWIGAAKKADIDRILASAPTPAPVTSQSAASSNGERKSEPLKDEDRLAGKAEYKGRAYLMVWEGQTKRGWAAKLAFLDGTQTFWAAQGEYTVTKRYQSREYRGRTEYTTWGSYRRFVERAKQAKAEGRQQCKCGQYHSDHEPSCYMCGCSKCEGAHGGLCEED
jgi:ribosomal protein L12E/L44/L45/RPP1/RPP2